MAGSERTVVTVPSLGDQSHRILRDMVTSGELAPGERVTERGLAARLNVSPTPIREAISRLTHERLLLRVDGRTLQVAAPSLRHLREMSLVHAALEGIAARFAAEYASREELDQIARAHRSSLSGSGTAAPPGARQAGARQRHEFHELIGRACRNPSLIDMIATAEAFGRPLRLRAQLTESATESIQRAAEEHGDIIAALRARDGTRAEELVREHTIWIADRYLKFAEAEGLVAVDEFAVGRPAL
ncbi:MAG TPA: GntR family transcriptional regulator [Trebonia sp.]